MKFYESLILGSTLKQHVPYFSKDPTSGCAIQLSHAAGYKQSINDEKWARKTISCPAYHEPNLNVAYVTIFHLNDRHAWPIDKIASWVKQFESDEPVVETTNQETECLASTK